MRFAAGELHDMRSRAVACDAPPCDALALGERGARRHFRDDETRAQARGHAPERRVGDARHRRQEDRIWQRDRADEDVGVHFLTLLRKCPIAHPAWARAIAGGGAANTGQS